MNRRSFSLMSATLAAAFLFPSLHCKPPLPQPDPKSLMPGELSAVLNRKEINEIGGAYRTSNLAGSDAKDITTALFTEDDGSRYEGGDGEKSIREYLGGRIKKDFENGKTVEINGWILSETEVRQCAYLSLIP